MKDQQPNKKKTSTAAVIVIFITIMIAVFAGSTEAAGKDHLLVAGQDITISKISQHQQNLSTSYND